jgi:hypothetical protein
MKWRFACGEYARLVRAAQLRWILRLSFLESRQSNIIYGGKATGDMPVFSRAALQILFIFFIASNLLNIKDLGHVRKKMKKK